MTALAIDTDDPARADAQLRALWPHLRLTAPGEGRLRIHRHRVGALRVDDLDVGAYAEIGCGAAGYPQLMIVRAGVVVVERHGDGPQRLDSGTVVTLAAAADRPLRLRLHHARVHLLSLSPRTVLTSPARATAPLAALMPASPAGHAHLIRVADYACDAAAAGGAAGPVAAAIEQVVASVLAETLPLIFRTAATPAPAHGAPAPAVLADAIAFIEDNVHRDITLGDIAAAVYVTPRALQYMFRKHRDCTPMEYLRRLRLDGSRRDLHDGDPTATSVGAVARRWRLMHLGRFAADYRTAFGENPRDTLHGDDPAPPAPVGAVGTVVGTLGVR